MTIANALLLTATWTILVGLSAFKVGHYKGYAEGRQDRG